MIRRYFPDSTYSPIIAGFRAKTVNGTVNYKSLFALNPEPYFKFFVMPVTSEPSETLDSIFKYAKKMKLYPILSLNHSDLLDDFIYRTQIYDTFGIIVNTDDKGIIERLKQVQSLLYKSQCYLLFKDLMITDLVHKDIDFKYGLEGNLVQFQGAVGNPFVNKESINNISMLEAVLPPPPIKLSDLKVFSEVPIFFDGWYEDVNNYIKDNILKEYKSVRI